MYREIDAKLIHQKLGIDYDTICRTMPFSRDALWCNNLQMVIPVCEGYMLDDDFVKAWVAVMRVQQCEALFAIGLEEKLAFEISVGPDSFWEFYWESSSRAFAMKYLFVSSDLSMALFVSKDDYDLVAIPPSYFFPICGRSPEGLLAEFYEFVRDPINSREKYQKLFNGVVEDCFKFNGTRYL